MVEYFVAIDRNYTIVFVNRSLEVPFKGAAESLLGMSPWQLWPEMKGTVLEQSLSSTFSTGIPSRFEFVTPNSKIWVEVNAYLAGDYLHLYVTDISAKKRADAELAESERNYRSIVDALPQIAWVAETDGHAWYFNARWYEYSGIDPAAPYEPSKFIHPEDLDRVIRSRTVAYESGTSYAADLRLRGRDGQYRWHHTRAEPIRDGDGKAVRYVGTSVDFHAERLATEALQEAEERLRYITDSVPALIAFVDSSLIYRFVNQTHERFFLKGKEELLGMSFDDVHGVELMPFAQKALAGEKLQFNGWIDYPVGRRFVNIDYVPQISPAGEVDGFFVLTSDITESAEAGERFHGFVKAIPQIAWSANAEGVFEFFNDQFYEYTGISADDKLDAGWSHIIHPEDLAQSAAAWNHTLKEGVGSQNEFRLLSRSGEYRWFLGRSVPIRDADGKILRWFGTANDVQEQKSHSEVFRFLFDLTAATRDLREPDEIMDYTVRMLGEHLHTSRCTYAEVLEDNDTLTNLHDWASGVPTIAGIDFQLHRFGSFVTGPLVDGRMIVSTNVAEDATKQSDREALEFISVRALVATPLMKEGRLIAILSVHSDRVREWTQEDLHLIQLVVERCWVEVERARAERRVRQSETRLRRILEAATVGVIVNDRRGTFTYANPPLLSLLGYEVEDLEQGRLCWDLIQAPDRKHKDDEALEQLRESGSCLPYETELVAKGGKRVPVYVGAAFVFDETTQDISGASFITDLTPLKAAQRDLEELNRDLDQRVRDRTAELKAANETLEAYSHHVAHDLRGPLRAIASTSRILEEDFEKVLPDEAVNLLHRQIKAAGKLGQLIDDLLRISRLSRAEMVRSQIDLSKMARDATDEALDLHSESSAKVEIQPKMTVEADPSLLRLAMQNLIENAIKYSPSGGTIRVGTKGKGVFFVADQGIGIDMAYADKIFEPFQRLHRDEDFKGTGVGLSNVMQVITRHGGKVWVESRPGKGATFYFTLE